MNDIGCFFSDSPPLLKPGQKKRLVVLRQTACESLGAKCTYRHMA